jgi:hypothetical protein
MDAERKSRTSARTGMGYLFPKSFGGSDIKYVYTAFSSSSLM